MSAGGEVAVLAVDGTALVADAVGRHGTAPTASAALGRALVGALLLACFKGEGEATQVTFNGNGPLGSLQAIATSDGLVKGRADHPRADPPLRPDGKLDVGSAVGRGVLAVVRSRVVPPSEGGGEAAAPPPPPSPSPPPYTGLTQIVSGEVAADLAHYLATSEQTNCALALGVSLDRDGRVTAAGGFLVQVLPFCPDAALERLEVNVGGLPPVTEMIAAGDGPAAVTARLLDGLGTAPGAFALTPRYGPCEKADLRARMVRAVALLGEDEVRDIVATAGGIEVCCEFCRDVEVFGEDEVLAAVEAARSDAAARLREGGGGGAV
jgi:molecular chaperone Hsp33